MTEHDMVVGARQANMRISEAADVLALSISSVSVTSSSVGTSPCVRIFGFTWRRNLSEKNCC